MKLGVFSILCQLYCALQLADYIDKKFGITQYFGYRRDVLIGGAVIVYLFGFVLLVHYLDTLVA